MHCGLHRALRYRLPRFFHRVKKIICLLAIFWMTTPILADLPTPPRKDIANGNNDWADVGSSVLFRVLAYVCYAMGAMILLGVAASVAKSYHIANEKQDLGHFFKMLVVGLISAALGLGLIYGGYTILPAQS